MNEKMNYDRIVSGTTTGSHEPVARDSAGPKVEGLYPSTSGKPVEGEPVSKSVIHSYPWYISDWRESPTRRKLTLEQRALYRELLDYCYFEGSLPDDERELCLIALASEKEFKRCWPAVRPSFIERDGRLYHQRVSDVRLKLEAWHEQKRNAGAIGGRAKASAKRSLQQPLNGRSSHPLPLPLPLPHPPPPGSAFAMDSAFEKLYSRHPKKKDRPFAETNFFDAMNNAPEPEKLFSVIDAAHAELCRSDDWTKAKGFYAPKLANWIADRGWTAVEHSEPETSADEQAEKTRIALESFNKDLKRRGLPPVDHF